MSNIGQEHYIDNSPEARITRVAAERDRWRASYQNAVNVLTAIYGLLNPPFINANGKTYSFENPNANETLQALSDAIRAIPEELRAPRSESARIAKDAARYRWLRDAENHDNPIWKFLALKGYDDKRMDALIDDEMAKASL